MSRYCLTFTARPEHIDQLGHVNNAVWVEWIQAVATTHWEAVASPAEQATYIWVVTRHEIDYRGNIGVGESAEAETFIPAPPTGARFDRRVDFRDAAGKIIVSGKTTWAIVDRVGGRIVRVPKAVADRFAPFGEIVA